MAIDEIQFNPEISYGAVGGATFSTTVVPMATGYEQRNQNWERSKGAWKVGHKLKFDTELEDLIAFFRARRGRARGFRFKDWSDYTATLTSIGTGDASEVAFQLTKTYADASSINNYERTITKPVAGTVHIFVSTVEQTLGVDFTVDTTTGIITFMVAPVLSAPITATFEFDLPARFDSDDMGIDLVAYDLSSWDGIPLVELPEGTI